MLKIERSKRFKHDYQKAIKRGFDPADFRRVVQLLVNEEPLPPKYRDHALVASRNYEGMRECHIRPDWLLIYRVERGALLLQLIRTGSHSDLFRR
jgi:mRNA interferase YafQ